MLKFLYNKISCSPHSPSNWLLEIGEQKPNSDLRLRVEISKDINNI